MVADLAQERSHEPRNGSIVACAFVLSSTLLTVSNTVLLRKSLVLPAELLILAQQIFIIAVFLIAHYFGFVKILPMGFPSITFMVVVFSFILYALLSMYSQSALELSLYTTLRKTQIILTICLEYAVLRKQQTWMTIASVFSVLLGSFMMGMAEFRGNVTGYLYAGLCNIFGATYIVSIARHKQGAKSIDSFDIVFQCAVYLATFSGILACIRHGDITRYANALTNWRVLTSVSLAGVMNSLVIVNTRINSPLSQSICSNIKDLCVLLIAQTFSGVSLSLKNSVGMLCTFLGAGVFCFQKQISPGFARCFAHNRLRLGSSTCLVGTGIVFFALYPIFLCGVPLGSSFPLSRLCFLAEYTIENVLSAPATDFTAALAKGSAVDSFFKPRSIVLDTSLLAVVTTSLSADAGPSPLLYLHTIQRNFASLCEVGFTVRVVFTAYGGIDSKWTEHLVSTQDKCQRNERAFRLEL